MTARAAFLATVMLLASGLLVLPPAAAAAPDQASAPSPPHGATGQLPSLTLSWAGSDPDGYVVFYVYMDTTPNFVPDWGTKKKCGPIAEHTCTVTGLAASTRYYWRVDAADGTSATHGPYWEFTTGTCEGSAPCRASAPSPTDGATDRPTSMTLSWTGGHPQGRANDYYVYVDTIPSFTPNWNTNLRCGPITTTSCTISGLAAGTIYYWRVDAADGTTATHGAYWQFTTASSSACTGNVPCQPSNPSPANGATGRPTSLTLSWTGGHGGTRTNDYYVYVDTMPNFAPDWTTNKRCGPIQVTTCTVSGLNPGTTYYWRVDAADGYAATYGPYWSFQTTGVAPYCTGPSTCTFSAAIQLSSFPFTDVRNSAGAGTEAGEPLPCGAIGETIWYRFTPSQNLLVTADTQDASTTFDTVLAAYRGPSLWSLTNVACNVRAGAPQSRIQFGVTAGQTYYIQVGGENSGTGTYRLDVSAISATAPGAPRALTLAALAPGELRATWDPPLSDGGTPITSWSVYVGDSPTSLMYRSDVEAGRRDYTLRDTRAREHFVAVIARNAAGESGYSNVAGARTYALYDVELRAWIPHARVVDPVMEDETGYTYDDAAARSWAAYGRTACNVDTPSSWFTLVTGYYEGDAHAVFDGSYRVKSHIAFRWDGLGFAAVDTFPTEPHIGWTHVMRTYQYWFDPVETCVLASGLGDGWAARVVDDSTFELSYDAANPLTPSAFTPTIDGVLRGTFETDGSLTLRVETDQFPSHGLRVVRNGLTQLTALPTDASCLRDDQVMGADGAANLGDGLRASNGAVTLTVSPQQVGETYSQPSARCA